jgi:hypothetical protein
VAAGAGTGVPPVFGSADGTLYYLNSDQHWDPVVTKHLRGPAYPG